MPPLGLKDKPWRRPFPPGSGKMQKIATPFEAQGRPVHGLGRQALAASGTPIGEHASTADCRFACAKPVTTLADKDARLKGAFHG